MTSSKYNWKSILLILLFVVAVTVMALYLWRSSREVSLKGKIVGDNYLINSSEKIGIGGVKIRLVSSTTNSVWETISDANGNFKFLAKLPSGTYDLYLIPKEPPATYYNFADYDPFVLKLNIPVKNIRINVSLNPLAQRDAIRIRNLYNLYKALRKYKEKEGQYPAVVVAEDLTSASPLFLKIKPYLERKSTEVDYLDPLTKRGRRYFRYYSDGSFFQITARGEIISFSTNGTNLGWEDSFYSEYQGRKLYNVIGK